MICQMIFVKEIHLVWKHNALLKSNSTSITSKKCKKKNYLFVFVFKKLFLLKYTVRATEGYSRLSAK